MVSYSSFTGYAKNKKVKKDASTNTLYLTCINQFTFSNFFSFIGPSCSLQCRQCLRYLYVYRLYNTYPYILLSSLIYLFSSSLSTNLSRSVCATQKALRYASPPIPHAARPSTGSNYLDHHHSLLTNIFMISAYSLSHIFYLDQMVNNLGVEATLSPS